MLVKHLAGQFIELESDPAGADRDVIDHMDRKVGAVRAGQGDVIGVMEDCVVLVHAGAGPGLEVTRIRRAASVERNEA